MRVQSSNTILEALEAKYNLDDKIKIYDQFIERQMSATQSEETRNFLIPIWRLRSSFNDALRPIEESMVTSLLCREKMVLATAAIKAGRVQDDNVFHMMAETRKCYKNYEEYLRRLKQLYTRTKHIFNTISYHKLDVLDEYAEVHDFDPIAVRHHYNRIVFVLEMSLVIGESILDAMKNAKSVVKCARENLETMSECYKNIIHLQQLEADSIIFPRHLTTSSSSNSSNTHPSMESDCSRKIPASKQIRTTPIQRIPLSAKPTIKELFPSDSSSEPKSPALIRIAMKKPRVLTPHEISVVSYRAKATKSTDESSASSVGASLNSSAENIQRLNNATLDMHSEEFQALKKSRGKIISERNTLHEPIFVKFEAPSSSVEYPDVGSPIIRYESSMGMGCECRELNSHEENHTKSKSRRSQTSSKSKARLITLRKCGGKISKR
ncbi:unnamed protein product [Allacma fusca]|uniref:Uncharacterized protein n=1 Tax=Allacma fusca TaxID=39272 RepID=A0A8J2LHJ9_9HEXA|nr:unnamed protein product [Allacma fusca]